MLNSGPGSVALHTHGHKVTVEAQDGVSLAERNEEVRDVVQVAPAQRLDLTLNTTVDGFHSYGPGVWFTHDHRERAVTTDGISPGGGITVIAYESYFNASAAMPAVNVELGRYFNASYYDGEVPYWAGMDDRLTDDDSYSDVRPTAVDHGAHDNHMHGDGMGMDMQPVDGGLVVNPTRTAPAGCDAVRGNRSVTVAAGEAYAPEGEMFGYNQSTFDFEPCTRVTVTLVNDDDVRHQWMVHGLPSETYGMGMFNLEADPGRTVTGAFVTPAGDQRLHLHCSLPQHQQKGMHGHLTIGSGGSDTRNTTAASASAAVTVPASSSVVAVGSATLQTLLTVGVGLVLLAVVGVVVVWRRRQS